MRNQIDFQVTGWQLLVPIGKRAHRHQLAHTVRGRRSLLTPPTGMFSHQVKLTIDRRGAHSQKSGPYTLLQLQMPVPFHGSQKLRQQRFQPLAANAVSRLPEHNQRFLHRFVINPAHYTSLSLARDLRGENPYRMLTMVPGHLGELVQDHLLAYPICRLIALSDGRCQFPSCAQLDPSPHFPPSGVVHAGSIFNEATTHLSVANLVSQCADRRQTKFPINDNGQALVFVLFAAKRLVTDKQVRRLFALVKLETNQEIAAATAGMDSKTAGKYLRAKRLRSELPQAPRWRRWADA